jgi:hypothetical protein
MTRLFMLRLCGCLEMHQAGYAHDIAFAESESAGAGMVSWKSFEASRLLGTDLRQFHRRFTSTGASLLCVQ